VAVERVVVDARAVDDSGQPLLGLSTGNFRVKVDGKVVPLESAQWVPGTPPADEPMVVYGDEPASEESMVLGRLIVFFFQKDAEESRITGLLRMQKMSLSLLDGLAPEDRVAVVSYDSRLKLRLDLTTDRDRLRRVMGNVMQLGPAPLIPPGDFPSLAASFDRDRAEHAYSPETALLVLADALKPLPGPKTLVMVAWGMGRFDARSGRVDLDRDYEPARRTLVDARVSVFCLDVTDADYHSLEVSLQQVASDTGGFYARTHLFPAQALRRLEGALAGQYILTFEKPSLRPGTHEIEVQLVGRKGTVMARSSYEG
jgi:VWFA-related protein